jgi:hypothetical protein
MLRGYGTMTQHPAGGRVVLLRAVRDRHGRGILRAGTVGRAKLLDDGGHRALFTAPTGQRALVSTAALRVFDPMSDEDPSGGAPCSERDGGAR